MKKILILLTFFYSFSFSICIDHEGGKFESSGQAIFYYDTNNGSYEIISSNETSDDWYLNVSLGSFVIAKNTVLTVVPKGGDSFESNTILYYPHTIYTAGEKCLPPCTDEKPNNFEKPFVEIPISYDSNTTDAEYKNMCNAYETDPKYTQVEALVYDVCKVKYKECRGIPVIDCEAGYTKDDSGICKPDIDCPKPMIYEVTDAWHGYWVKDKRCIPNKDLSKEECESISGAIYGQILNSGNEKVTIDAMMYGEGCTHENYGKSLFLNDSTHDIIGFMPFSPLWNANNDLVVQSINKLFGAGKNAFNAIKNKFASSTKTPKPNLQTHQPEIIDMQIASDGVAYEIKLNAKTPPKDNPTGWNDIYQTYRKNGWDLPKTPGNYNPKINDPFPPTVNVPKFPSVVKEIDDFIYKGGDAVSFENNMIGTANASKDGSVPNLSLLETSSINKQVETTINLNSKLVGVETKSYPTYLVKDTQIALSDRVESTYKGYTKYPDGSKTFLDISRTKYNVDGRIIDDVTTKTNIPTKSGTKTFNTSYQTFKDGNGVITNTIHAPTSITTNTTTGSTTTTNQSTNTVITNSSKASVNLTPVIVKLESIDSKLKSIIDTKIPKEISEATVRIQEFETSINVFDVNFNTYKDFLDGMIDNFNDLGTLFDDSKAILENKPVINEITGTCGFNASFFVGQSIFIDPCMFVAPYRPLLALVFTLLATFSVIGFSVKYLVAKGD